MEDKANFPLLGAQVIYIDQIKSHPTQRISGNIHKLAFLSTELKFSRSTMQVKLVLSSLNQFFALILYPVLYYKV